MTGWGKASGILPSPTIHVFLDSPVPSGHCPNVEACPLRPAIPQAMHSLAAHFLLFLSRATYLRACFRKFSPHRKPSCSPSPDTPSFMLTFNSGFSLLWKAFLVSSAPLGLSHVPKSPFAFTDRPTLSFSVPQAVCPVRQVAGTSHLCGPSTGPGSRGHLSEYQPKAGGSIMGPA